MRRRSARPPPLSPAASRAADRLGVFSLALGAAELIAPRKLARVVGNRDTRLVRLYGLREIATGAGILAARNPRPWVWARVAGDVLDLATLLRRGDTGRRGNRIALASIAGALVLDTISERQLARQWNETGRRYDYSNRTGFPRPPAEMRGVGRRPARPIPAEAWQIAQR